MRSRGDLTKPSSQHLNLYLIITNLAGGGAERSMLKIAKAMSQAGHHVRLILLEDRCDYPLPSGIELVRLFQLGRLSKGWFGRRWAALKLRNLLAHLPLADLVISTLPFADEVTSLARVPNHVARIANTLGMELKVLSESDEKKSERRLKKYRRLYSDLNLVAVSQGVAEDLRRLLTRHRTISVIPNLFDMMDIRSLASEPLDLPVGFPKDFVLHAGRFARQKRHDVLLDAWKLWADAPPLVLLTEPHPSLREMIFERGLQNKVFIAGFVSNPYPWYSRAKCLVLCSDHEGLPNVLLEALACGTPVVSTDCPSGPAEILRNYPQCLVPCGDPGALVGAVRRCCLESPDVSNYDFSAYASDRVIALWESLARS